mmetsp:Transcript_37428/g.116592  ORF Transcript_37428/g.116592 Transcript_37428/m.116592 type:complete len:405 (+) Transcript_37428:70-1284(+)
MDFDELEERMEAMAPAMTFYAISDVHVELKNNMRWLQCLASEPRGTVLVAGDLGVSCADVEKALRLLQRKYAHVFYCFGNHELWLPTAERKQLQLSDSFEKMDRLRETCRAMGVKTSASLVEGVWVVPIFGWYHESWDTEPPLAPPKGAKLACEPAAPHQFSTDYHLCKWGELRGGSEELAARLDKENERWGAWPLPAELLRDAELPQGKRERPIISFSHFLPRLELLPEKRFLFQPNLAKVAGSSWIRRRVDELRPDVHVFGHTHFAWDMELDGVRYRSWPLGTEEEHASRMANYPTDTNERWLPLKVFDSNGEQSPKEEVCFSAMYDHILREPDSCVMSPYTAPIYCPSAPTLEKDILAPGNREHPKVLDNPYDLERRDRYDRIWQDYKARSIRRWTEGQAA